MAIHFARIESLSTILLFIFLTICTSSIESWNPDCDLKTSKSPIYIAPEERFINFEALNLNFVNRTISSCSWQIYQKKSSNSFLELNRVILDQGDSLTVLAEVSVNKTVTNVTLFEGSGSIIPGLISTAGYTNVYVKLHLSNQTQVFRLFASAIYWDGDLVRLSMDSGTLSFPLNQNATKSIVNQFTLQPSPDYSDRVILLSFLELPPNASFLLNGVEYNQTNPPPSVYLRNETSLLRFTLEDYQASEPILVRYWLVSGLCSGEVNVAKIGDETPIPVPDETVRQQQKINQVICAQLITGPDDSKFQLVIDPNLRNLANPGDMVNFYRYKEGIELSLSAASFSVQHRGSIDTYLTGNRYLVVYESPFSVPNPNFTVPLLKSISTQQAQSYVLSSDKPLSLTVDSNSKSSEIVHLLYTSQEVSNTNNIILEFGDVSLKPGQASISIYNTDDLSASPIITLGSFASLPLAIPSNTAVMRVVYSGLIPSLKVNYRSVDSKRSCGLLSDFSPSFEVKSKVKSNLAQHSCSWYIPEATHQKTVINPTILKLPQGVALVVKVYNTKEVHTDTFQGPINSFYLPDMFLDNSQSYEFILQINSSSIEVIEDYHLLITKKKDYLIENIVVKPSEKISHIASANYPGLYPIGVAQEWSFSNQSWALITIEDVHLTDQHHLTLEANQTGTQTWSGDVDLAQVPDYLVRNEFSISLDAKAFNITNLSNRGYRTRIHYPDVADDIQFKTSSGIEYLSQNISGKFLIIWRVSEQDAKLQSDSTLKIKVTTAASLDKSKARLNIYDSISLRDGAETHSAYRVNGTDGTYHGSIKSAFIVYEYDSTNSKETNYSVKFQISSEKCSNNYNLTKCKGADRCITDEMACNGIDDCGDYSDELFCVGSKPIPPSPTPSGSTGVNALVVIFVLMPIGAVLGILGYVFIPRLVRRFRAGPGGYSELSEVS